MTAQTDPESQPNLFDRLYAPVRLLSLDIVVGAVAGGRLVAYLLQLDRPLWSWYLLLGLSVWLVYTLDHLLDGRRLKENASTPRHQFHHRYFIPIAVVWAVLAMVCLALAFTLLDQEGIVFGLGLGAMVLVHLLIVKLVGEKTSPLLIKEGGVALIYVAGIWGLPMIWERDHISYIQVIVMIQYFLLALSNLLEFSIFEHQVDEKDGQTSFVRAVGPNLSVRITYLLLAATVSLSLFLTLQVKDKHMVAVQIVIMVMAFLLGLVLSRRDFFVKEERYRAFADGVFILPACLFLLS